MDEKYIAVLLALTGVLIHMTFQSWITNHIWRPRTVKKRAPEPTKPDDERKALTDCMILAEDTTVEQLDIALECFCRRHAEMYPHIYLRMREISSDKFIIDCPVGIDFDHLCSLIASLASSDAENNMANITGWTTTEAPTCRPTGQTGQTGQIMLYVSAEEVRIVHENGGSYKYHPDGSIRSLSIPEKAFRPRPLLSGFYPADKLPHVYF
ncbi:MAG: hypothetical protein LBH06_02310 [Rikenellaceae bacterium]|jgi:hypothetical protein|nr:hypothetical protein [Rikenellaceae bacterium]